MQGYNTIPTRYGKAGISLAKEFVPDLIICDVLMLEMNGHEVLRQLLDCPATASIPFIFSTSLSEKLDWTESLTLGADDYLVKPFELGTRLNKVKIWIKSGTKRCGITGQLEKV